MHSGVGQQWKRSWPSPVGYRESKVAANDGYPAWPSTWRRVRPTINEWLDHQVSCVGVHDLAMSLHFSIHSSPSDPFVAKTNWKKKVWAGDTTCGSGRIRMDAHGFWFVVFGWLPPLACSTLKLVAPLLSSPLTQVCGGGVAHDAPWL